MSTPIIMPKFEMSQETGTVTRWLKQEGDAIEKGEAILEVETDKVTMEVESPAKGILSAISAQPGDVIPIGQVIAQIESGLPTADQRPPTADRRRPTTDGRWQTTASNRRPTADHRSPKFSHRQPCRRRVDWRANSTSICAACAAPGPMAAFNRRMWRG